MDLKKMDQKEFDEIITGLRKNKTVKLDIIKKKLTLEQVKQLEEVLKSNTSLTGLRLLGNKIGDTGVSYLSKALEINTRLQFLSISFNQVGAVGATHILKALKVNTSLQILHLTDNERDNRIGADLLGQINALLTRNRILRTNVSRVGILVAFARANATTPALPEQNDSNANASAEISNASSAVAADSKVVAETKAPILHVFTPSIFPIISYIQAMAGFQGMKPEVVHKFFGYAAVSAKAEAGTGVEAPVVATAAAGMKPTV